MSTQVATYFPGENRSRAVDVQRGGNLWDPQQNGAEHGDTVTVMFANDNTEGSFWNGRICFPGMCLSHGKCSWWQNVCQNAAC